MGKTRHHFPLKKGTKVEVTTDEEGFKDAWYEATIVSAATRRKRSSGGSKSKILVQYETLMDDEDETKPLNEYVDVAHVRPPPPSHLDDGKVSFELYDLVDAWHRDGWWTGVVKEQKVVVAADGGVKYVVFFRFPPEDVEFRESDLRHHLDWVGGEWVRPENQGQIVPLFDVNDMERDLQIGRSDATAVFNTPIQAANDVDATQVSKKLKLGNAEDGKPLNDVGSSGSITAAKGNKTTRDLERSPGGGQILQNGKRHSGEKEAANDVDATQISKNLEVGHAADGKPVYDAAICAYITAAKESKTTWNLERLPVGGQILQNGNRHSGEKEENMLDSPIIEFCKRKKSSAKKSTVRKSNSSFKRREAYIKRFLPKGVVQTESVKKSLVSEEPEDGLDDNSQKLPLNASSNSATHKNLPEHNELPDEDRLQSKQRGTPKKPTVTRPEDLVGGDLQMTAVGKCISSTIGSVTKETAFIPSKECLNFVENNRKILNGTRRCTNKIINIKEFHPSSTKDHKTEEVQLKEIQQTETNLLGRHQQKSQTQVETRSLIQESQALDGKPRGVIEAEFGNRDVDNVMEEMPSDIIEHQPLLDWFGETNSQAAVENSGSSHGEAPKLCEEGYKRKNEMSTPSLVGKCPKLPFVKSSPIWTSVESLEVFLKKPQRPHFSPLLKHTEDSREGLAIGLMVTFANVVSKISSLQIDEPKSVLETLAELESQGFDVDMVRARLNEFLSVKGKMSHLERESAQVATDIKTHAFERAELDKEIDLAEMKLQELQEKLNSAKSTRAAKIKEVSALQSKQDFIRGNISNFKLELERLLASPL